MNIENSLTQGTEVDCYLIYKAISVGGFSIVYLAQDQNTGQKVIIKEFMPKNHAKRLRNNHITPISKSKDRTFQKSRILFFQEASILTTLKHPNIVNVINFFRCNSTVYMVMQYEQGKNLQTYIKQKHNHRLSERFILTVFPALLKGLQKIHDSGYLHLDVKPGNIHIRPGGRPLLLDFGSVHRRELSRLHQPGQITTTGFAPLEQYRKTGYIGPWTDLYAIGATMRACIEGHSPPDARTREDSDQITNSNSKLKRYFSLPLLQVIDWCMEINPELRPQSVSQLLSRLTAIKPRTVKSFKWLQRLTGK